MPDALQKRARETERFRGALGDLAALLPGDDAALDALLVETAHDRDEDAFVHLLLAALHARRKVDGRALVEGAVLLSPEMLIAAAVHCAGDVGGALLDAVRSDRLPPSRKAMALALSAWWSRERDGGVVSAETIREGRVLARDPGSWVTVSLLLVLSDISGDGHLAEILSGEAPPEVIAELRTAFDRGIDRAREDPLGSVPEERPPTLLSGYTVRRAALRVGRNDPCPCGSGKKYKRCCFDADRERLRHSSDMEGLTVEELRENPGPHLTLERLDRMTRNELARLDATQLDPALLGPLASRLTWTREFDALIRLFEKAGHRPDLDPFLLDGAELAADLGRAETVKRLLALRSGSDGLLGQLRLGTRIIAEGLVPGRMLEEIETEAGAGLDDPLGPVELAHALCGGACPKLGILVARGALWTANEFDGYMLLQVLLETRDRLDLAPVDPVEELVAAHWGDEDRAATSAVDEEARQELAAKLAEARRLRADLRERDEALRHMETRITELESHSRHGQGDETRAAPPGTKDTVVAELRRKLTDSKTELKRKHAERNELRAELERTREEANSLRARVLAEQSRSGSGDEREEAEDESLFLPEEFAEQHPPRLPHFERSFSDDLRDLPAVVTRAALRLIGRLAAGEASAFRGARRLRTNRDVWRQRVGAGHRLLFRATGDTLVFLALVTRQDFPRAVRSL